MALLGRGFACDDCQISPESPLSTDTRDKGDTPLCICLYLYVSLDLLIYLNVIYTCILLRMFIKNANNLVKICKQHVNWEAQITKEILSFSFCGRTVKELMPCLALQCEWKISVDGTMKL